MKIPVFNLDLLLNRAIVSVKDLELPLHSGSHLRQGGDLRNFFNADALYFGTLGLPDGGSSNAPRPAVYGCSNSGKPFFVAIERNRKVTNNAENTERA